MDRQQLGARRGLLRNLAFERAQGLIVYIPFLENGEDGLRAESGAQKMTENTRRLFLIGGLLQALAVEIITSLLLVVNLVVGVADRFFKNFAMYALGFQVSDHAAASEFLVVAAKGGIGGSVVRVVQVSMIFQ